MIFSKPAKACIAAFVLLCNTMPAQNVPDSISYQAVLRDVNGDELANETVTVVFGIRQDAPDGLIVFHEQHDLINTNQFGLFDCFIGGGTYTGLGFFASLGEINWSSGKFFLEVSATIPGNGSPQIIGTSQLLAVPYAFHAGTADFVLNENDGAINNEIITDIYLSGENLVIEEGDAAYALPVATLGIAGVDISNTNELISDVSVINDTTLVITEATYTTEYDVSDIAFATWQKTGNNLHNNSQAVGIGTDAPQSSLHVNGSLSMSLVTLSTPGEYFMGVEVSENATMYRANLTSGNVILHLPDATACAGRVYKFSKKTSNPSTYIFNIMSDLDQIEGAANFALDVNINMEFVTLMSDGSNWIVVDYSIYNP